MIIDRRDAETLVVIIATTTQPTSPPVLLPPGESPWAYDWFPSFLPSVMGPRQDQDRDQDGENSVSKLSITGCCQVTSAFDVYSDPHSSLVHLVLLLTSKCEEKQRPTRPMIRPRLWKDCLETVSRRDSVGGRSVTMSLWRRWRQTSPQVLPSDE